MAFPFKPAFGTATTATTAAGFGFGSTAAVPAFGTAATVASSTPAFGTGFSFGGGTASTLGFGATTATTAAPGFGFGAGLSTAGSAFGAPAATTTGAFGFGAATTTTATPLFGAAAVSTAATPAFGGFGTGTAGGFGTAGGLGSTPSLFGATSSNTSTGSVFGFKPATTAASAFCNTTGLFTAPQASVSSANVTAALRTAVSNPLIFGDERDSVIAKWNQLQACWGTGRGYINSQGHFVDFAPDNPFSVFKVVGYNMLPMSRNEDGLVALTIDRKMSQVCDNQQAIVDSLQKIIVNNPQFTAYVCVDSIRPLLDDKTEVTIYVQQRANTGVMTRITTSDLLMHITGMTVKQQLATQLAVSAAIPKCGMTTEQIRVYLDNPPAGIDARIWEQAKLDNPDPSRMIPVPIVGFAELYQRLRLQQLQADMHQSRLDLMVSDMAALERSRVDIVAKAEQYKRHLLALGHRILKVLVKQELDRKRGYAVQVDEEQLRTRLESISCELSAPMQCKGRLDELMSQLRMQNQIGAVGRTDVTYQMDKHVQQEIKQHLSRQQEGLSHLMSIIKDDLDSLEVINNGLLADNSSKHHR